jgi:amino acid transporter
VVRIGSPDFPIDKVFPFLTVFAVANTALINMLMASRLVYGMARQRVLPRQLGTVLHGRRTPWAAILFTTVLAVLLIWYVSSLSDDDVTNLGATTSFLLLCVFTIVNVSCTVLKRRPADHRRTFFTAPVLVPPLAALLCLYLAGPWVDRDGVVYEIAGLLMAIGVGLWLVTWLLNRVVNEDDDSPHFSDLEHLDTDPTDDPR